MPSAIRAFGNIRRQELPLVLGMFLYLFLVITSFWVLKPLKKSLFIAYYDDHGLSLGRWRLAAAEAELLAKALNVVGAYAAVITFTLLARRHRRHRLTLIFTSLFILGYAIYGQLLDDPSAASIWTFYLFGDLFSTVMVATFFAFLNDVVEPEMAKRTYGVIGLGGILGGVCGSTFMASWIRDLAASTWMWICVVLAASIMGVATVLGALTETTPDATQKAPQAAPRIPQKTVSAAIEGAMLTLRSNYLLAIVGIVSTYELISAMLDFQFSATIAHYADGADIGKHISQAFMVANVTALIVQAFFTSFVMQRLGQQVALSILPWTALMASLSFFALPVLPIAKLLSAADNGLSYSIHQSAKEALYIPISVDEKYKAKAFIDMFVQRAAKVVAIVATLAMTAVASEFAAARWLSPVIATLCIAWLAAARRVGRRFETMLVGPRTDAEHPLA